MKWMSLLILALTVSAVPLSAYQRYYETREIVMVPQVQEVIYVRERVVPQPVVVVAPQPQVCYVQCCRPQPQVSFSIGGGSGHRSRLSWNVNWSGSPCCY
jgi:hypothetical protein